MKKKVWFSLMVSMIALVLVACGSQSETKSSKLNVVATTDFYGEVLSAVVGNKGEVTSIINSSKTDPHDFEPTTKTAKEVNNADFVVANGLGYDSWMNRMVKVSKTNYLNVGTDVANKKTGDNPHIWYDPEIMSKVADEIAKRLSKIQPKSKKYFEKNAANYKEKLQPMQDLVAQIRKKYSNGFAKKVFVSEPVFDYSLDAMGFEIANPKFEAAIEKGVDPSPEVINAMQTGLRKQEVNFFVVNKQVDNPVIKDLINLAKKHDVAVLEVTETLPEGKTYINWLTDTYEQLEKVLLLKATK